MDDNTLDYYFILDIPRTATKEEVILGYRKMAVKLCPFRNAEFHQVFIPDAAEEIVTHMAPAPLCKQWDLIHMAYDILTNDNYRAAYDRLGLTGLRSGVMLGKNYVPPYQYHGDNMEIYVDVFGSDSAYANLTDVITHPPKLIVNKKHGIGVPTKNKNTEMTIFLSLEEIRLGVTKNMQILRQEFIDPDQTITRRKKVNLWFHVAPGTTPGTRYTFKEQGDHAPFKIPSDIVFTTADRPHDRFERRNFHDLVYRHKINLLQALTGFSFTIETLDKRKINVRITDVVHPKYVKVIPNEGLPKCTKNTDPTAQSQKPTEFGNMIIEFRVSYPKRLNYKMKIITANFFFNMKRVREAEGRKNMILPKKK